MHDPTEGGLATACWEMAEAAEAGVRIERERVPVLPEGARLCAAFGLDPLGTIASGALLLAVAPADAARVETACRAAGIACAAIGAVTERREGTVLMEGGRARPLPVFAQDEISKLFAGS
jgi:hydrogenase maturation factor